MVCDSVWCVIMCVMVCVCVTSFSSYESKIHILVTWEEGRRCLISSCEITPQYVGCILIEYVTYLQWTTIGPSIDLCSALIRL